ncbi:MAG: outer membrane protein assembly factor BamD [Gammaproteobacteria bacterium]|nr:outer membrane protein assembly factor BamD [Gammaproteobacteria bacterium]
MILAQRRLLLCSSLLSLLLSLLVGCSSRDQAAPPATLGDIKADASLSRTPALLLPPEAVAERYAALLAVTADEQLAQQARYRKADLGTLAVENQLAASGAIDEAALNQQIAAYQELLSRYPSADGNDEVLYQLAKVQALKGDSIAEMATLEQLVSRYPQSARRAEVEFRRGDHLYNEGRYGDGWQAFSTAATLGSGALARNGAYMAGWCQFKRGDLDAAGSEFLALLKLQLGAAPTATVAASDDPALSEDLLRALSLTLLLGDGVVSLDALLDEQSAPAWDHLLYGELAALQASKEFYQPALETYARYGQRHPGAPWAARFDLKALALREQAGFLNQLAEAQAAFVADWGVRSPYWQQADAALRSELQPALDGLQRLLAEDAHARAQSWPKADRAGAQAAWLAAAERYRQLLETSPQASDIAASRFLLADTLLAGGDYQAAATTFAQVAYQDGGAQAAEAGYGAVVASQQRLAATATTDTAALATASSALVDYALKFATTFASDSRAAEVRLLAADTQVKGGDYAAARQTLAPLTLSGAGPERHRALLTEAFAAEALADHVGAEQALAAARPLTQDQALANELRDRQAVAIYRQGEAALAAGERNAAIGHFQRLATSLPTSPFAKQAQYDAATLMLEQQRTAEAVALFESFRLSYPQDPLTATLPAKLATAYAALGQPARAADELERLAALPGDGEAQRNALLLAVTTAGEAGDSARQQRLRQQYLDRYPQPLATAQQLRFELAKGQSGSARTATLTAIVVADRRSSGDASSRALAIEAALLLARDAHQACLVLPISQPLAASVKRKRAALETARGQWQQVLDYRDRRSTAEATYQVAELYAQLASALLSSPPPPGLDELALEEYQFLLEEQAYPFEEKAIATHEANLAHGHDGAVSGGSFTEWMGRSLSRLAELVPGRYRRGESELKPVAGLEGGKS